ncbi:hypothetical protein QE450_004251 [Paenibacillus sp. SORGH_AS306]|uniref:hypothetical protein n=1 Tax=unclassified Paenibacillus TaxID=185978 RepID=UPI00277FE96E|nr:MULTISPECIES: hypothetical protein [unclassified Paenibacillus]MDQ1236753.1 hypothetical protein [Paenibacillus sp. SORGH_AS_0306]MDR6109110.1 hypothetical protein [Paenibacillus sp. SORGH_AS_0338]
MNINSRTDFYKKLIAATTHEQNKYNQIQILVRLIQIAHKNNWNEDKNDIFKNLVQIYLPYLKKMASKMYSFDPLIDKNSASSKIHWDANYNPILSESLISIIGILWEIIIKYDENRGVYFTHFIELSYEWYYKKLCRKRVRKKKYPDRLNDDYRLVSYEELLDKREDSSENHGLIKTSDIKYDDNFDLITFEWSLTDPKEFVENNELFEITSSFTNKQMEVYSLELRGYKQRQIADEIKKLGIQITQQGVQERLIGVRKKIEKSNNQRGVSHGSEKSNNYPA